MSRTEPEAVLITGVYGTGKSSMVEEMADVFEKRGTPYAALDLDWLAWFDTGRNDDELQDRIFLQNLEAVVANYRSVNIERYLLALFVENEEDLQAIRDVLDMLVIVIRLTLDLRMIEERLGSSVTTGRRVDLHWAGVQIEEGRGVGLEDFTVANDRPIPDVAQDILDRLGWR